MVAVSLGLAACKHYSASKHRSFLTRARIITYFLMETKFPVDSIQMGNSFPYTACLLVTTPDYLMWVNNGRNIAGYRKLVTCKLRYMPNLSESLVFTPLRRFPCDLIS